MEYHSNLWDVGCNKCGIVVFSCGIPKSVESINISTRPSLELPRGHLLVLQSHDSWRAILSTGTIYINQGTRHRVYI
jgi:hypothetical protein